MRRFGLVLSVAFFLATSVTFAADKLTPPLNGEMARLKVFEKRKPLPEIVFSTISGGRASLSMHKGHFVLLNVWATWCPPCVKELPALNALQLSMDPSRFQVVNVSLDTMGPETIQDYLTEHNLKNLLPYVDMNQQVQTLEVLDKAPGIPITIMIDPQMRAVALYQGDADWNGKDARSVIDYYLKNVSYTPFDTSEML